MTKDSGKAIRNYLVEMSNIIKRTASKSHIVENRSLYAIAKAINKLATQDLPEQLISTSEFENDPLEKVSHYIDLALNTFENIRGPILNDESRVKFISVLSETYETRGNYEAALANYSSALILAKTLNNNNLIGNIQYRMARIYSQRGNWQKAQSLLHGSLVVLKSVSNHSCVALSQIELAKITYRKGEYSKAQKLFNEALETSELVSDVNSRATISNHLGIIRRMEGDHSTAFTHFQEALIEFQSIKNYYGTAESLNNLGLMHLRHGDFREAVGYFDKALQLCQEIGNYPLLAFVYLNRAEFHCDVGDYPMAAITCGRALEILVRLKNPIGIAKTNRLFGRVYWKSGEIITSEAFFKESIKLYMEFSIPLGLANCYHEYAKFLEENKEAEKAREIYAKAQEIYDRLNSEKSVVGKKKLSIIKANKDNGSGYKQDLKRRMA